MIIIRQEEEITFPLDLSFNYLNALHILYHNSYKLENVLESLKTKRVEHTW